MTFITADTVAGLTGFADANAFLRARPRLERDHDFPAPMPTCLRPMKWRADAVTAWTECQGQPALANPVFAGPNVVMLDEARRS